MSAGTARSTSGPGFIERHYTQYLIIIALAGWALASYDFNLLVNTFPDIAKSLNLSSTFVGLLGFIVYSAMFTMTFSPVTLWIRWGENGRGCFV